jgi:hypothetical protein
VVRYPVKGSPLSEGSDRAQALSSCDLRQAIFLPRGVFAGNEGEFEIFGASLRDHETSYEYALEWLDIVKLAWSPARGFRLLRTMFKLKGVRAKSKPYGGHGRE